MEKSDILAELNQVTELISLPEVYLKVQRLLDDDSAGANDFAQVIAIDPNLSARVLRIVNSAFFGLEAPVDNLALALNMIGRQKLQQMVLSVSAVSSFDLPNDILPLEPFWFNSLFTGVLARVMADSQQLKRSDRLFIAGLFHNIGNLVLCAKFPQLARQEIQRSAETRAPQHVTQTAMFDIHYGEIAATLLNNWNMPPELQTLVRFQPTPLLAPELQMETCLLHLARAIAFTNDPADLRLLVAPEVFAQIPLKAQDIDDMRHWAGKTSKDMVQIILS